MNVLERCRAVETNRPYGTNLSAYATFISEVDRGYFGYITVLTSMLREINSL